MSDGDDVKDMPVAEASFRALLDKLSEQYNFDFREYKEASLARRIRARMAQVRITGFDVYSTYLDEHPDEHVPLFNTILINVTAFFRDPEAWKALAEEIIPRIVANNADTRTLRIWSAGCSSGEEPYTIAIALAECLGDRIGEYNVKIYGTDIDEDALSAARHAFYRTDQLKDLPDDLVDRYFSRDGQVYRFRRDLRRWCIFGAHNITQAPPLSHIDLLVCRNVLIYFSNELQQRILSRFHYALRPDGYLFLGRSESLLARSRLFLPVHLKWRIFQRAPAGGRLAVGPEAAAPNAGANAVAVMPAGRHDGGVAAATRVQKALDAMPLAVLVIDNSDTILTWNPAAEHLFDIPAPNAVARKFRDLDISYRIDGLRARIEDVKARHASARMDDVTFTRRNGELVHVNFTITPLFENYRLIGVLVSADEATEHARLKEQMARVAEQHATAIEELQSTNEELETTNEELQSTNEELETTNEELQSTNEELETTVEELQAANTELNALNAELETRTGELTRFDVYHRAVVNSLDEGLLVVDRGGVVRTWNQVAERMWGLRAEQVVGRELFTLSLGGLTRGTRDAFDRVLTSGRHEEVASVPFRLPGGEERTASLRLSPVKDQRGDVVGVVGTAMSEPVLPAR